MGARLPYIDAAKGIGILLVVLGHIVPVDSHVKGFLYSFHMPLFFILAGMVLPCAEKIEGASFLQLFLKRCKSLLLPYFLVGGGYSLVVTRSIKRALYLFYGSGFAVHAAGSISSLWFLPVLFLAVLMAFLLVKYGCSVWLSIIGMFIAGMLMPEVCKYGWPFGLDVAFVATAFVLMGFALKGFVTRCELKWYWMTLIALVLLLIPWGFWKFNMSMSPAYVSMWKGSYGNIGWFLLNALAGAFGVIAISKVVCLSMIQYIGRASLWIFVLHRPVLKVVDNGIVAFIASVLIPVVCMEGWKMVKRTMFKEGKV